MYVYCCTNNTTTLNLPNVVQGMFPHCFNKQNNYWYIGLLPALHYYEVDGLKEPLCSTLIKWHGEHSNDVFIFYREIHEYCTADITLLKSGCTKFRASFLADTGIILFAVVRFTVLLCTYFVLLTWKRIPLHGSHPMVTEVCETAQTNRRGRLRTAKRSLVSDTSTRGRGVRCTWMMPSCGQTNIMSLDIINGSVPFLSVCTTVAHVLRQAIIQCHAQQYHGRLESRNGVNACGYITQPFGNASGIRFVKQTARSEVMWIVTCWPWGTLRIFAIHNQSADRSVIKYVDVHSLYPYGLQEQTLSRRSSSVPEWTQLRGLDVDSYEGLFNWNVLP